MGRLALFPCPEVAMLTAILSLCLIAAAIERRRTRKRRNEIDKFMEWNDYEKLNR